MATTLTATYQAGTTTEPPSVLLQVTGAPSLPPKYVQDTTTTDDGWTGSAGISRTTHVRCASARP